MAVRFVKVTGFFANTEYEDLVTRAYTHVTRGHLRRLKGILKEIRLIENVEIQTTIINIVLAKCVSEDQMKMFTYVIDQPEVDININIATGAPSGIAEIPVLCFAFFMQQNKYARLLLEHPSMLLLNDVHRLGVLPMMFACSDILPNTNYYPRLEDATAAAKERLCLIELMIEMGAIVDSFTMDIIKRSPYKEKLVALTESIWSSRSKEAKKRCDHCFNTDKSLRKCARCRLVYYCSISCQKMGYERHKEACLAKKTAQRASRKCNKCGVQDVKLQLCGKCNSTYYCSVECQYADWKVHKLTH